MIREQKIVKFVLTPRQTSAYELLTNDKDLSLMYGGAKGGGKSFLECIFIMDWMRELIKFFGLTVQEDHRKLPILGFWGRKQGVDFYNTTLETFKRAVPDRIYTLRENEIVFYHSAKILFGGLDDRKKIEKFNSAEYAFIVVGQAEETERNDVQVLQAALRLKINGKQPPYKELYTANPGDCWLKEDFIDTLRPGSCFIPALPKDNPHLPPQYEQRLRDTFRHSPALIAAYLDGDWSSIKATNALISSGNVQALKDIRINNKEIRRVVVCDPSLGGDECVIYFMENCDIKDEIILVGERDTMKICGHMITMAEKNLCKDYAADTTGGLGHAILDRIREQKSRDGARCHYINSSEGSTDSLRWLNVRAEMWWYAMEQILDYKVPYPMDEEIRRQITAPRYKVIGSSGLIQLELKSETKKRLLCSPDRGDTWVMGVYITRTIEPLKRDSWKYQRQARDVYAPELSAMAA